MPQGTNVNNFHSCKQRGAAYGNTRTTAVFTIKYLNSLGFEVNNEPFEKNSWYFRNALVRANYTNMNKGIYMNTEYLEKFFRNLLLGESNELKNRYCHIKYNAKTTNKVTQKVIHIFSTCNKQNNHCKKCYNEIVMEKETEERLTAIEIKLMSDRIREMSNAMEGDIPNRKPSHY